MPKSVKMLAVVDDGEVEIGRCHPGQARLLIKKELADWRDGGIVLRTYEPEAPEESEEDAKASILEALRQRYPRAYATAILEDMPEEEPEAKIEITGDRPLASYRRHDIGDKGYLAEILAEAGAMGDAADFDLLLDRATYPEEVTVSSMTDFMRQFVGRVLQGHETWACDDPQARVIGFVDGTVNEWVTIPLRAVRECGGRVTDNVAEEIGITSEALSTAFRTTAGRASLFGHNGAAPGELDVPEEELDDDFWFEGDVLPDIALEDATVGLSGVKPRRDTSIAPVDNAEDLRASLMAKSRPAFAPVRFPGWTSFVWPGCEAALPVFAATPEGRRPDPEPADDGVSSSLNPPVQRRGVYRRVRDRVLRVWVEGPWWDEALLQDDGTYLLISESRSLDSTLGDDGSVSILSPASFHDQVRAAIARAEEIVRDADRCIGVAPADLPSRLLEARPGDTYLVRPGSVGVPLVIAASGTAERPIRIEASFPLDAPVFQDITITGDHVHIKHLRVFGSVRADKGVVGVSIEGCAVVV